MARYRHLYILLQVNSPVKKFSWVVDGLGVGENYVWYLFIVVIFMEHGGAVVVGGGENLKSSHVRVAVTRGPLFM